MPRRDPTKEPNLARVMGDAAATCTRGRQYKILTLKDGQPAIRDIRTNKVYTPNPLAELARLVGACCAFLFVAKQTHVPEDAVASQYAENGAEFERGFPNWMDPLER